MDMDIDISDILASVSAPSVPASTLDLQALTRAWINERCAPDLLPYPIDLIERCTDAIKRQISMIEEMTGSMDPGANFTLVVLQTELERWKFLVRGLIRARIAKIDKCPLHYRARILSSSASQDDNTLLSSLEQQYLASHTALLHAHYQASFLSAFPTQLQKMDDTGGGISMVDKPDEDTAVFCRVLSDGFTDEAGGDRIELKRGDVWVLRWSAVKERVMRGDVELV